MERADSVDRIEELRYDVVVVGAGPVGLTTALMLGRRGWRVAVIERWPAPYARPRAVHFDGETARLFASAGIGESILPELTERAGLYQWQNAAGSILLNFDFSQSSFSGWPNANMFNQPTLESALESALGHVSTVDVFRGCEAVELEVFSTSVRLVTRAASGRRAFTASWAIGCDGANSFVRSRMATTITDLGFFFDWLIVDVVPHEPRIWEPHGLQICDPKRPTTVVSGGPGRRRWEFMRMPGETIEELNNEDAAWRLLAPWDLHPGNAVLERHAVYTFEARWADEWRDGRLLIAGDSAHLMPPFAGQGMCSGIRDAGNLTWKLDLVLRGVANESLMDTYSSERKAHVQHAIGVSVELGKVICVVDPQAAAGRDAAMLGQRALPDEVTPAPPPAWLSEGMLYRTASGAVADGAGALSPQPRVTYRGRTGLLDDVAGPGLMVVALDNPFDVLGGAQVEWLARCGAHVMQVVSPGAAQTPDTAVDVAGDYLRLLSEGGFAAIVIRPDYYVFGGVSKMSDLPHLVDDLYRQLRAESRDNGVLARAHSATATGS